MTDSTASLPRGAAERWGVEVVPLEVALGDVRYREGVDLEAATLLDALTGGTRVTTSQPPPLVFAQAYAHAAERGAREIVSVHLSGELSGTVRAAEVAALASPVPVHVVDSRTVALGLGFAALSAARLARGDGAGPHAEAPPTGWAVAERARAVAASSWALFLVDGLEHLRRGGRIGPAAAAVGGLLGMRPLLTVRDGRVEVAGTVRTRRAGRDRLLDAAVAAAGPRPGVRLAVHHLGAPDLAAELAEALGSRLGRGGPGAAGPADDDAPHVVADDGLAAGARPGPATDPGVVVTEVSAVVGAHAGPGLLGVVVADR